jgi:hypothetical protein
MQALRRSLRRALGFLVHAGSIMWTWHVPTVEPTGPKS